MRDLIKEAAAHLGVSRKQIFRNAVMGKTKHPDIVADFRFEQYQLHGMDFTPDYVVKYAYAVLAKKEVIISSPPAMSLGRI